MMRMADKYLNDEKKWDRAQLMPQKRDIGTGRARKYVSKHLRKCTGISVRSISFLNSMKAMCCAIGDAADSGGRVLEGLVYITKSKPHLDSLFSLLNRSS